MWLDAVGWLGSALLIYSVMQARVLRFRVLNLGACVVLTGFNAALGIWPMVAMNVALCGINLWHIRALVRTRHDEETYSVLEVDPADDYLRHMLRVHEADILAHQPDLLFDPNDSEVVAYLVLRADETVGVVLLHDDGDGTATVLLDYVTPKYRDFSPGEFVWRRSGALADRGFHRVRTPTRMIAPYYGRLGFRRLDDGSYELELGS